MAWMLLVVLAIFVACFLGIGRIVTSPFGQVLKMIRENEPRAVSLGYEVDKYKLLAFVLSAALAGLAGALKTVVTRVPHGYRRRISPNYQYSFFQRTRSLSSRRLAAATILYSL
jgi:ABC-type uncharacterized transport system permease subunit